MVLAHLMRDHRPAEQGAEASAGDTTRRQIDRLLAKHHQRQLRLGVRMDQPHRSGARARSACATAS